nr:unnamed protein product [Timema tahoe]
MIKKINWLTREDKVVGIQVADTQKRRGLSARQEQDHEIDIQLVDRMKTISVFGRLDNTVGSAKLMYTFLQNVPLEDCDSSQAPEVRPLDQTQLCAGGNLGKDACRGDSGGPLIDKRESPTTSQVQTYQLGIVSFGSIPCGSNKAPSVFTRVSEYLDWILDNIHP